MTPETLLQIAAGSSQAIAMMVSMLVTLAIFAFVMWSVLTRLIFICGPNEVLVISGGTHIGPDGQRVGYRIVKGGRALRIPFLEACARLSLEPHSIERQLEDLDARDGVIGSLELKAMVKISSDPRLLPRAIERFLGAPREDIGAAAEKILEGEVQEVLASMALDEIADRKHELGNDVADKARVALEPLGLELDQLSVAKIRAA